MLALNLASLNGTENLLVESTGEVDGTGDGFELREVDRAELVVASDQETTVDSLQNGKAEVVEVRVVLENKVTSLGKVGSRKRRELVTPETQLTLKLLERGKRDGADVTDGQVRTRGQVGKQDFEILVVTSEVDQVGGVLEVVHVNLLEVGVVGDDELADSVERDSVQGSQASVDNLNVICLGDTLVEAEVLEHGKSLEVDRTDLCELRELEAGESHNTLEVEGVIDGGKFRSRELSNVFAAVAGQSTLDSLDTVDGDGATEAGVQLDVTVESLAAAVTIEVALTLDGDGLAGTTVCTPS